MNNPKSPTSLKRQRRRFPSLALQACRGRGLGCAVVNKLSLSLFICVLWLAAPAAAADSVLHLVDGSFLPGELRPSDDRQALRWRSPSFAWPFEFPLAGVNAVHYAVAGPPPKASGEYCVELVNDDVLYGHLLRLTDDEF